MAVYASGCAGQGREWGAGNASHRQAKIQRIRTSAPALTVRGPETSEMGYSRRFGDVRVTSAFPLIADVRQRGRQVRKVPGAVIQRHVALNVRRSKTTSVKRCEKRSSEAPAGEVQS